ncbi:hypothetical protein EW145_g6495 [Phellinidium pouzarii]|uniref:Uncharacterized protein n=1 Tax=Phellinidium pouzarii TaxID=167371 RepID=A0A4S4KWF5_9AGAM|nr:hypothetical protein EW145_g6495 [Phellinidium pouzarii]
MEKHPYTKERQVVQSEEVLSSKSISTIPSSKIDLRFSGSSPIQFLIPDILIQIFMMAIPRDIEWSQAEWNRIAPNNVAAVSRYWRNVALSHAILWATFNLTDKWAHKSFLWNQLPLFMRRSGQTPFNLTLTHLNLQDYTQLTSIIHDHQHLCKHIKIEFQNALYEYYLTPRRHDKEGIKLTDIPILETLHLRWTRFEAPAEVLLSNATSLTVLDLYGSFILRFDDLTVLNLTDITLQSFEVTTTNDCLQLLQICPALENFSAEGCYIKGIEDSSYEVIYHPNLISLSLRFMEVSALQYILQRLHLISLKQLTIGSKDSGVDGVDVHRASALISRSHCLLESLDLRQSKKDEIVRCLKLSPNLKHLALYDGGRGEGDAMRDVIIQLALKGGDQVCPELKSIKLCFINLSQWPEDVVSMVYSRWHVEEGAVRNLESVILRFCGFTASKDLDDCRNEGLKLKIID